MQKADYQLSKLENMVLATLSKVDSWILPEWDSEEILKSKKGRYLKLLNRKKMGKLTYTAKLAYRRDTCGKVMLFLSALRKYT